MSYVYDVVLNFNSELYEFFEWNKDDTFYHIKRINLALVNSKTYNDIYDNIVTFDSDFLLSIYNKCEYYTNRKIETLPYAFLLTDSYRVMGILLDNNGKIIKYSSLLLDEEEEVLDLCYKLGEIKLIYTIINKNSKHDFLTRNEVDVINYLKKELTSDYKKNNLSKLKYLYYEYFNKYSDNIDTIYHELLSELKENYNSKLKELYNLIKLSYSGKNV